VTQRQARKTTRLAPEDRISEILASARVTLAQKGYENFLPTDVAARCGVSEALIYRYFPTKRDLLAKVAEDWFDEILSVEPAMAQRADPYDQLRLMIRHSLGVIKREPQLTRFVLTELRSDPEYRSTKIYALNRRFTSAVLRLVKDGVAQGMFRPDASPTLVRDLIFGGIEHRTWNFLRGQGDFSAEAVADAIVDLIFHGLARRTEPNGTAVAVALDDLADKTRAIAEAAEWLGGVFREKPRRS
jgi:AcrR family transcriptional regulator